MTIEEAHRIVRAGPPPLGGATGYDHSEEKKLANWRGSYNEARRVLLADEMAQDPVLQEAWERAQDAVLDLQSMDLDGVPSGLCRDD